MAEQQQPQPRRGREGGRWINERPTPEDFASWFTATMKLDPALNAEDYMGGVVVIPAVDRKSPTVVAFRGAVPVIEEREELSYIPYAKVETRIAYFWDLLAAHEDDWVGVVEHVELPRLAIDAPPSEQVVEEEGKTTTTTRPGQPGALASMVYQLPPGFSLTSIPVGDGYTHFLLCTIRVSIYRRAEVYAALDKVPTGVDDRDALKWALARCIPLRTGRGSKQVPLILGRQQHYADPSSLMKAETGALGRSLGAAGIFVIPGSGIATAEDIQEQQSQGNTVSQGPVGAQEATNAGPAAPEPTPVRTGAETAQDEETQLSTRATELWKALSEEHPDKATEFGEWARERKLRSVADATGATLRGVVKKLEKFTEEAEAASQQGALPVDTPAPPEPEADHDPDSSGSPS